MNNRIAVGVGLAGAALSVGLCMMVLPMPAFMAPWGVALLATGAGVLAAMLALVDPRGIRWHQHRAARGYTPVPA